MKVEGDKQFYFHQREAIGKECGKIHIRLDQY
jgi:hypothetical protein